VSRFEIADRLRVSPTEYVLSMTGVILPLAVERAVDDDRPAALELDQHRRGPRLIDVVCTGRAAARVPPASCEGCARTRTGWRATSSPASARSRPTSASSRTARSSPPAGVSAGIDMALVFAARLAGDEVAQAIQLSVEYDAQPPFDTGTQAKGAGANPGHGARAARRRRQADGRSAPARGTRGWATFDAP
jgi:hypothetical protein